MEEKLAKRMGQKVKLFGVDDDLEKDVFLKKWANPAYFSFIFNLFNQTLQ